VDTPGKESDLVNPRHDSITCRLRYVSQTRQKNKRQHVLCGVWQNNHQHSKAGGGGGGGRGGGGGGGGGRVQGEGKHGEGMDEGMERGTTVKSQTRRSGRSCRGQTNSGIQVIRQRRWHAVALCVRRVTTVTRTRRPHGTTAPTAMWGAFPRFKRVASRPRGVRLGSKVRRHGRGGAVVRLPDLIFEVGIRLGTLRDGCLFGQALPLAAIAEHLRDVLRK